LKTHREKADFKYDTIYLIALDSFVNKALSYELHWTEI